jgi:hypothetical protein
MAAITPSSMNVTLAVEKGVRPLSWVVSEARSQEDCAELVPHMHSFVLCGTRYPAGYSVCLARTDGRLVNAALAEAHILANA